MSFRVKIGSLGGTVFIKVGLCTPLRTMQTLNVVMLIASAKSRSGRGASHQPAVMVSCLTISPMCLPCLPSGRVSHCVPGFTEVGSCCCSRKWVWSSRTKLSCMASGK